MNIGVRAKSNFDFVILDTPPVGVVTDAAIISTYADGTILVVASGNVEIEVAQRAKELLMNVNANILGAALTKFLPGAGYYKYYYYGGYYDDEDHKKRKKVR